MKRLSRSAGLVALWLALPALAQEKGPPTGPAQIFNRGAEDRAQRDVAKAGAASEAAASQADPAPVPAQGPSAPHPPVGHPDVHTALAPPTMPSAEPAAELPRGTIAIDVLDPQGDPFPNAEIVLGVMASVGARTEQRAKSDAAGQYRFTGLATGSQQAYRVNVVQGGAKFSSTPFQLPDSEGYRVRIPLKATTRSDRMFFQLVGQTVVELRDDRLHITQQARLANAGQAVYVLPKDGIVVPLPEGFTAFQWQDQMTDQKGEEVAGRGFRLRGSFPAGTVTLAWSFDVKRDGESARVPVTLPWKTYTYRVIAEAPEGLKLRVTDFPEPEQVKDQGRTLLFTQLQRQPGDPLTGALTVKLDGIPGPGPGRWIASALALLAVLFGLSRALRRGDDSTERGTFIAARKQALLGEVRATEAERARGEIGPEYHGRRIEEIVTELALLLRDEETLAASSKKA
jgi:Carboxypeptidase regulatory-like domain